MSSHISFQSTLFRSTERKSNRPTMHSFCYQCNWYTDFGNKPHFQNNCFVLRVYSDTEKKFLDLPIYQEKIIDGRYYVVEEIGKGSFGVVNLAYDVSMNRFVAMKFIEHRRSGDSAHSAHSAQSAHLCGPAEGSDSSTPPSPFEQHILSLHIHPSLLSLLDFYHNLEFDGSKYDVLVTEYCPTDLHQVFDHTPNLPEGVIRLILRRLLLGLVAFHEQGYSHLDIKPQNILINTEGKLVLADFGLASDKPKETSARGSRPYMAWELLYGGEYDPQKADIWSLGVTAFSMIFGCVPFGYEGPTYCSWFFKAYCENDGKRFWDFYTSGYKGARKISQELELLLRSMMTVDPSKRMSASELLLSPFLCISPTPDDVREYKKVVQGPMMSDANSHGLTGRTWRARIGHEQRRVIGRLQWSAQESAQESVQASLAIVPDEEWDLLEEEWGRRRIEIDEELLVTQMEATAQQREDDDDLNNAQIEKMADMEAIVCEKMFIDVHQKFGKGRKKMKGRRGCGAEKGPTRRWVRG